MNTATKEAYKGLVGSVWGVFKAVNVFALLVMAGYAVIDNRDYASGAFYVSLAVFLKD